MSRKRKLDKAKIFELLKENRATLNKLKVRKIGLFGSYAEGTQTKKAT